VTVPGGRRPLGRTGLAVSPVCVGTSPLASMPQLYGYEVSAQRAQDTIRAVFGSSFNFLDTSNNYGGGAAEERIGRVLAETGGLPPGFVLATKVDADPVTGDFSGERVRRSAQESLERLGLDRIQLLYLHDPEFHLTFAQAMAPGGAIEALTGLRDQGVAGQLGVAGGEVALLHEFAATGQLDVVLNHNRFTLLDRSAEPLIDHCADLGLAFVNAAPYGGGILVKGPGAQPRYGYQPAPAQIRDAVRAMQRACAGYGVPLAAAALQFSVRDPRVASTVVGVSGPERVKELETLLAVRIPDTLWAELEALAPGPEYWLG
jgi:aryl-alcohol dehydrogenase-like predicted oxidoreductase